MAKNNAQITVTTNATSLQSLLSDVNPYGNSFGIQIENLSSNANSVFWGLANNITTSSLSSEIPPGCAQLVMPAQAQSTANVYLIAVGSEVACVSFIGG